MTSISCSAFDCADGDCQKRCFDICGGESKTSEFKCDLSDLVCACVGTDNRAAIWGSVAGVCFVLLCAVTFYKYWCGARRASERQRIVVVSA